jgi:hypothetical protein
MTLPAYRSQATDTEQVLGREGERDGIDIVVEQPTAEDEEAMRDEEMEALYQIRAARRRQLSEREDRRQRRRDARDQNDVVALEQLRQEGRDALSSHTDEVDGLRREYERAKETRQRAVSSVSYHELGVARADGTRIRAGSFESERAGLLSDAASIAASGPPDSLNSLPQHRRGRSASSVLSVDTATSQDRAPSPNLVPGAGGSIYSLHTGGTRSRSGSATGSVHNTPRRLSRAGSSPEMIDAEDAGDLGAAEIPPHSPPGYDDVSLDDDREYDAVSVATPAAVRSRASSPYNEPPPDYPGPTQTRLNRLSAHMADLASETTQPQDERRSSRGVGGVPQLPSLRLNRLPQIVIEPSSAWPRDEDTRL